MEVDCCIMCFDCKEYLSLDRHYVFTIEFFINSMSRDSLEYYLYWMSEAIRFYKEHEFHKVRIVADYETDYEKVLFKKYKRKKNDKDKWDTSKRGGGKS